MLAEVPQELLDERRRLGHDVRDEMWDGVLHMVPPPSDDHQDFNNEFFLVVAPLAKQRGLVPRMENGLFRTTDDYRVPDQLFRRPDQRTGRGTVGAELIVEVRSPRDETYKKIDFYSQIGVREMIVIHPDEGRVELFRAIGGRLISMQPGPDGRYESEVLGITVRTIDGKLEITWDGGSATL
jgi:Uma2 family endonuclease